MLNYPRKTSDNRRYAGESGWSPNGVIEPCCEIHDWSEFGGEGTEYAARIRVVC
jgi:hypothetical protein